MAIGNVHKNLVMIGREMKFRRYAHRQAYGHRDRRIHSLQYFAPWGRCKGSSNATVLGSSLVALCRYLHITGSG